MTATALRRFAEAFVALANSDDKKAKVSGAVARKALDALSTAYQTQIAKYWDAANEEALQLLVVVMENNPHKSRDDILRRPDVRDALRQPYLDAAAKSEALLRKAWTEAENLSVAHAKAEFKMLSAEWAGHAVDPALRDALVGDLYKNARAMRSRYRDAMSDPDTARARLTGVADDGKRRARYSIQVSVWGVATQVRDSAAAAAGLNKMWVAVMDDRTCSHCTALHGRVIGPGEQFPADAGATPLGVYMGVLFGPPRHPNCRCVIVPTKSQKTSAKF